MEWRPGFHKTSHPQISELYFPDMTAFGVGVKKHKINKIHHHNMITAQLRGKKNVPLFTLPEISFAFLRQSTASPYVYLYMYIARRIHSIPQYVLNFLHIRFNIIFPATLWPSNYYFHLGYPSSFAHFLILGTVIAQFCFILGTVIAQLCFILGTVIAQLCFILGTVIAQFCFILGTVIAQFCLTLGTVIAQFCLILGTVIAQFCTYFLF